MTRPETHPPTDARTAAVEVIRVLHDAGHVAYLAGGCVRDALLGLNPKDCDVATAAEPEAVKRLFRGGRLVGEAFGVVRVPKRGWWIEVATFPRTSTGKVRKHILKAWYLEGTIQARYRPDQVGD